MKKVTVTVNDGLMKCTCIDIDGYADPNCEDCNGDGIADYTALFWKEVKKEEKRKSLRHSLYRKEKRDSIRHKLYRRIGCN